MSDYFVVIEKSLHSHYIFAFYLTEHRHTLRSLFGTFSYLAYLNISHLIPIYLKLSYLTLTCVTVLYLPLPYLNLLCVLVIIYLHN